MEENKVNTVSTETAQPEVKKEGEQTPATKKPFKKGGKKNFQRPSKKDAPKEFEERVVALNRVTKVVKGGKRMKFAALVVVGDGKGRYGFATGKSGEVPDAIKKAVDKAKKNVTVIKMAKGGTITHDVIGAFGATRVFLKPAPEGTGIIAGGPVRAILELGGVKNVYSKVYGSRTPINIIRATNAALKSLKNYKDVATLRKGGTTDVK